MAPAAHGIVGVRPKKGWYVIEPTDEEIRQTFAARRLVEGALLRDFVANASPAQIAALEDHLQRQHAAIAGNDVALRTHLLTDFHVKIAQMMGNEVLTRLVRDMTMRTNLMSMLYQSSQEASHSCDEHEEILTAVRARRAEEAVRLMAEHLASVERGLRDRKTVDPIHRPATAWRRWSWLHGRRTSMSRRRTGSSTAKWKSISTSTRRIWPHCCRSTHETGDAAGPGVAGPPKPNRLESRLGRSWSKFRGPIQYFLYAMA